MASFEVGQVLAGKLLVEGVLGKGGMGVVLVARHTILNERVAVKLLRVRDPEQAHDPTQIERFHREARASAKLRGLHVSRVMDVGTLDDGSPYIVMEYIEGVNLAETLKARGRLPLDEAIDWVLQTCEGLAEAHALGIVHRDLKPSNLMLTRGIDGSPLIKILDFGIAKALDAEAGTTLTGSSVMLGSPSYMSPEQIRDARHVDVRTDLWSLGVTLYELITQALPFEAFTPSGLIARITVDPPRPPSEHVADLPPGFEAVVLKCLEKDPAHRFQSVAELAEALMPYASPLGATALSRITRVLQGAASGDGPSSQPGGARRPTPATPQRSTPNRAVVQVSAQTISHDAHTISADEPRPVAPLPPPRRSSGAFALLGALVVAAPVSFFVVRALQPTATAAPLPTPAPLASAPPSATIEARPTASAAGAPSSPSGPVPVASVASTPAAASIEPSGKPWPRPSASAKGRPTPEPRSTGFVTDFGDRK